MLTHQTFARRSGALVLAAATALALAAPAVAQTDAGPWPMAGQGAANTSQAAADGPSDPGVRWATDLEPGSDLSFDTGALDAPILHPDGVLIRRATAGIGDDRLVGIDVDNGDRLWTAVGIADRCLPTIDSQGRLWVMRTADMDTTIDTRYLHQINPNTGAPVPGTAFAFDPDSNAEVPRTSGGGDLYCWGTGLQALGSGANERLIVLGSDVAGRSNSHVVALDISSTTPSLAWSIDADDADFDRILAEVPGNLQNVPQPRVGAATSTEWLLPVQRGDQPHLARLSLATGALTASVPIPVVADDGSPIAASDPWSARTLIVGNQVVVASRFVSGFSASRAFQTSVHSFALSNLNLTWTRSVERRQSTSNPGATLLASTGGTVVFNAGLGTLQAVAAATGAPTSFDGEVELRELGANATPQAVADASGNLYLFTTREDGAFIRLSPAGVEQWRVTNNALETETRIAPGIDAQAALIDDDGVLYVYNEGRMFALDSSGGLSECILPFTDVSPTATHAVNICRLVAAEITAGLTPTTYGPRGDVTREQMATFLARALGLQPVANNIFDDVVTGSTHAGNINAIAAAGITQGRRPGVYDPRASVTRAEMATFLARAADLDPVDGSGFADVPVGSTHERNIYAVRDADITQGTTPTAFRPDLNVRRDQMASFLMRMVDFLEDQD